MEDLRAVAAEAGEPVTLCAFSSGVPLALAAAQHGVTVKKLALYKFPLIVDDYRSPVPPEYQQRVGVALLAAMVAPFPVMPGWSKVEQTGHTLSYDL